jgi:hypothetical protein
MEYARAVRMHLVTQCYILNVFPKIIQTNTSQERVIQSYTCSAGMPNRPQSLSPQQYKLPFVLPGPFVIAHV